MTETNFKTNRINECIVEPSKPFEKVDRLISNVSKSICKIKIETSIGTIKGTRFLLAFWIEQERFFSLVSNEHVIRKELLHNDINIYLSYDSEFRSTYINLNNNKRYMNSFKDNGLDITIVEILDEDNISKDYYLYPEIEERINNELINNSIYIPQYPGNKELMNAKGKIKEINKYEFTHLTNTKQGSSGSPIFLEDKINVIGIHKQGNINKTENYGNFIYPAINIIKNDIRKKRNNGKYINGKYIWDDGKYYIGEFKNNLPNGKGIKYYSNGNILYEGNFINGKFDGNGKYYYDDGRYFIGEYKNGLRNGKGRVYYKNGKIGFEGNYINDKAEGNGKYIWEEGEYYIGQYKNDLRNGKGTEYYSNGKIKYEGDWINDKAEGNGKYIWENGEYYIGQFKNGFFHGKGTQYYSNRKIKYEGDWINDKKEGNGKYIWEDGEYYIGQEKNDLRHGKGTEYYSNGKIKYQGDWIYDKKEGNGKYIWEDGEYYIGQFKNGLAHGKGTQYYSNGKIKYQGDWIYDKKEGNGKYIWEDGEYYIGQEKNDLRHGRGTMYYSNGKIKYEGYWFNDEFVSIKN